MNARDRTAMEQLIAGQAEIKTEIVAATLHLERINGSIAKHFDDDRAWMAVHENGHLARESRSAGFRAGLVWPLAAIITVASIVGPVVAKVILG